MGITENGSATSRELGRPHPEERACRRAGANQVARARVSKDGDGPSCFETADGSATSRELGMPAPPHPEERACRKIPRSSNGRARVSKDGAAVHPSCFETPRHSASKTRVNALKARLLSMREERAPRSETRSRSREEEVLQSKGCSFFLFSSCSGQSRPKKRRRARISAFDPVA